MLNNDITRQPMDNIECDCKNCQMVEIGDTGVVECLMKGPCQWAMSYGYSRLCTHPSAKLFARFR